MYNISTYIIDILNYIRFREKFIPKLSLAWLSPTDLEKSTRYFYSRVGGYIKNGYELPKKKLVNKIRFFISSGDWDMKTVSIYDILHIERTIKHYQKSLDWEEVGEIDWMMNNIKKYYIQDGCRSYLDVINRLKKLDDLKAHLEEGGDFLTQKEINPHNFRENGGIGVAIARDGEPIWMGNGAHRLAIAKLLNISKIPVCLKIVHSKAIADNTINRYISF
tara:strand:+ start:142 stop:801 length:660 start_codon:yes stop_codon:yes gene_type:complete